MNAMGVVRMLEMQKKRLREAKAHQGERRTPLNTRTSLLSEYSHASVQHSALYTMQTTIIDDAYPLCLLPLKDLQKISLQDLQLETHHRGSVLIVRTFGVTVKVSAAMNAIEDETEDVERLAIYNFKTTLPTDDILAKNTVLAIKEPFYKMSADGRCIVRVDHPSDAVILEQDHPLYPSKWKSSVSGLKRSALAWKLDGNAALKSKEYVKANRCYTQGLKFVSFEETDLKRDLYRNRSFVGLTLGRYDAAKADAIASVSGVDSDESRKLDVKALYRAGCAAYRLREFPNALKYFEKLLALSPSDEDGNKEIQRTKMRLQEEQKGVYDFEAISKAMPKAKFHVDHADFTSRTSIRQTEHRGRGLFATRNFHAGDLILCEKAFFAVQDMDKNTDMALMLNLSTERGFVGSHVTLWAGVVHKILDNPSTGPQILDLHAGSYPRENTMVQAVDEPPVVDTFLVQSVIEHNTFGLAGGESEPQDRAAAAENHFSSCGLWSRASYVNHPCLFNAERSFIGDMMIVRATKDISEGAELTIPYWNIDADVTERKEKLSNWGFDCDCALCSAEGPMSASRKTLIQAGESFLEEAAFGDDSFPSKQNVERAERLVRDIELTYEGDLFHDLPHLASTPIYEWLCQAHIMLRQRDKVNDYARDMLRSQGYKLNIHGSQVDIDRTNGVLTMQFVDALMYICSVHLRRQFEPLFVQLREMAKCMYLVIRGVSTGSESRYGRSW